MDEQRRQVERAKEPELKRPDEAIEDLEPEREESGAVKGGAFEAYVKTTGQKQG